MTRKELISIGNCAAEVVSVLERLNETCVEAIVNYIGVDKQTTVKITQTASIVDRHIKHYHRLCKKCLALMAEAHELKIALQNFVLISFMHYWCWDLS